MFQANRSGRKTVAVLASFVLFAFGCAGMNPDARMILQQPTDCANAGSNIEALKESRAGGFWRFTQGFQGIAPPMIVLSLLRDVIGKPYRSIYLDHWRVAFGSYNRQIDERVGELEHCGAGGASMESETGMEPETGMESETESGMESEPEME